jgi:hypothetical protein
VSFDFIGQENFRDAVEVNKGVVAVLHVLWWFSEED